MVVAALCSLDKPYMLLKQMLEAPTTSSNLVVFDPFQAFDRETLVKEVLGLANARVDGPRNILFGVNPGAMNGSTVVGIPDSAIRDLKRAHRFISALVEPVLDLAFIFDSINGKLVGALEIDGCDFGPYFLAQDLSDELRRGACWIREDRELVAVERRELLNTPLPETKETAPDYSPDDVSVSIGFNEDPDCEFIEVSVPDTSTPPFAEEGNSGGETRKSSNFTQTLKDTVGTVTTRLLSIARPDRTPGDEAGDADDAGKQIAEAARKHYYYEECAVKVDLCIHNDSDIDIRKLSVEFGVPRVPGFDVADRIYQSPFDKSSEAEMKKRGYPEVKHRDDAILVRTTIDHLPAKQTQALLRTPLRLAVGPDALGKKIAMQYVLRAASGQKLGNGRLKIRLR